MSPEALVGAAGTEARAPERRDAEDTEPWVAVFVFLALGRESLLLSMVVVLEISAFDLITSMEASQFASGILPAPTLALGAGVY